MVPGASGPVSMRALLDTGSAYGPRPELPPASQGILPVRNFSAASRFAGSNENRLSLEVSSGRVCFSTKWSGVRYVTGFWENVVAPDRKNDNGYLRALHPLKAETTYRSQF